MTHLFFAFVRRLADHLESIFRTVGKANAGRQSAAHDTGKCPLKNKRQHESRDGLAEFLSSPIRSKSLDRH